MAAFRSGFASIEPPRWVPAAAGIVSLVVVTLVSWALQRREAEDLGSQTLFAVQEERRIIYREMDATAASFRRAGESERSGMGDDRERRELTAFMRDVPGLDAAVRVTREGTAAMTVPRGFDVAPLLAAWRRHSREAEQADTLSFLPLDARGVHFALASPICRNSACDGAIVGVLDARALFSQILAGAQRDFLFVVVRNGEVVGTDSLKLPPSPWHRSVDLQFGDAQWQLVAFPTADTFTRLHTRLPVAIFVLGLIVSGLLAVSLRLARTAWAAAHASERARRSDAAMKELEALAAMGSVAARVAHEINNPLAGIQYSFLLIKNAIPEDHPHFSYVGAIEREIARIAAVTRQLYETYRPERETGAHASLPTVIGDAVAFMQQVNRAAHVEIVTDLSGAPAVVPLSAAILRQVVYNLVQNAMDASPPGGTVVVAAATVGNSLEMRVSDDGPGIAPELRERIFEPFFSTKDTHMRTSGMGLGLALVRRSVDSAGGRIAIERAPSGGALFIVTLPLGSAEGHA
jgi:signal transduction histidine kinase